MECRLPGPFLCGLCLMHLAWCTTVIPLCESNANCTTPLVHKEGKTRVSEDRIVDCGADKKDYCIHGRCQYIVELEQYRCWCQPGFTGERCVYSELVMQPMSNEYVALTVILSILCVFAFAVGVFFMYKWYKSKLCKKEQQPTKEYKEVKTCSV